jgi:hypothetical protein
MAGSTTIFRVGSWVKAMKDIPLNPSPNTNIDCVPEGTPGQVEKIENGLLDVSFRPPEFFAFKRLNNRSSEGFCLIEDPPKGSTGEAVAEQAVAKAAPETQAKAKAEPGGAARAKGNTWKKWVDKHHSEWDMKKNQLMFKKAKRQKESYVEELNANPDYHVECAEDSYQFWALKEARKSVSAKGMAADKSNDSDKKDKKKKDKKKKENDKKEKKKKKKKKKGNKSKKGKKSSSSSSSSSSSTSSSASSSPPRPDPSTAPAASSNSPTGSAAHGVIALRPALPGFQKVEAQWENCKNQNFQDIDVDTEEGEKQFDICITQAETAAKLVQAKAAKDEKKKADEVHKQNVKRASEEVKEAFAKQARISDKMKRLQDAKASMIDASMRLKALCKSGPE